MSYIFRKKSVRLEVAKSALAYPPNRLMGLNLARQQQFFDAGSRDRANFLAVTPVKPFLLHDRFLQLQGYFGKIFRGFCPVSDGRALSRSRLIE